jgi:hypothetical protein
MDKRVLYNLLRLNYKEDSTLEIESWQVEDLRTNSDGELFEKLKQNKICLDKPTFNLYIENATSPEDLTYLLTEDIPEVHKQDQVYLLIFELWRRFAKDKPSISIFCDELDRKIEEYDLGDMQSYLIADILFALEQLLEENLTDDVDPRILFQSIVEKCANDVESFLYDFISDQLDQSQTSFAKELIEGFEKYCLRPKWFLLLKLRLSIQEETTLVDFMMQELMEYLQENELEFSFEVLDFILQTDQMEFFFPLIKQMLLICEKEADFQDILVELLQFLVDFDYQKQAKGVQKLLEKRKHITLHQKLERDDPDLKQALEIIQSASI